MFRKIIHLFSGILIGAGFIFQVLGEGAIGSEDEYTFVAVGIILMIMGFSFIAVVEVQYFKREKAKNSASE